MSDLSYQLLSKAEQDDFAGTTDPDDREQHTNAVKKIIARFTLPEASDAIGRKKEFIEKIHKLILIGAAIAIVTSVFYLNYQSFPEITSSINSEYYQAKNEENKVFPLPVFGLCFSRSGFRGWIPVVWRMSLRENFHAEVTTSCMHWSPTGQRNLSRTADTFQTPVESYSCDTEEITDSCKSVVTINRDRQCVSFGDDKCPIWQALRRLEIVEIQLLGFWARINQFPATTPGGWYESSDAFFSNPSSYYTQVLLGGISQAILEFHREEHKVPDADSSSPFEYLTKVTYPTSTTTLNIMDTHLQCTPNTTLLRVNRMCYPMIANDGRAVNATPLPFSVLELQLRLATTKIPTTKEENGWYFIYRSLKDIGGFSTTLAKILFVFISIGLTRIIFSNRNAFFDEEIRLAVTHFIAELKHQRKH